MQRNIKKSTKLDILNTAIDLFSKKGFSSVSIRDITRRVGIKESSLYNHYKSKDEILVTIFDLLESKFQKSPELEERVKSINAEYEIGSIWMTHFEQFKKQLIAPQLQKLLKILIMEQFRNKRARKIILTHLIEEPVKFTEKILKKIFEAKHIKADPVILAVEFQYPLITMKNEYILRKQDNLDVQSVEKKMKDHIVFFTNLLNIKSKD